VRLLALAEEIRGFGPVKEAAIQKFQERVELLEQEFLATERSFAGAASVDCLS